MPNDERFDDYTDPASDFAGFTLTLPPANNVKLTFLDANVMCFQWRWPRTLRNRFKLWMLCLFFPFKIEQFISTEQADAQANQQKN